MTVVLVLIVSLSGAAKPVVHRLAVPSAEECVRRGIALTERINELPSGAKITIGCEFTKS